ncbi:MAG: hypothetical protein L0G39_18385 [Chryseobacterium sp.]|nr:hypothetical protein [Chryseobacterium sp.]
MKRPIFQYRLIYWIAILVNISISFFYGTFTYSMAASSDIDSKEFFSVLLIAITWILSLVSLFFLIKKHKLASVVHSLVLILVIINFLKIIFEAVFYKQKLQEGLSSEDYIISSAIYLLFFGIWLIVVRYYRFIDSKVDLQIENIGKHTD